VAFLPERHAEGSSARSPSIDRGDALMKKERPRRIRRVFRFIWLALPFILLIISINGMIGGFVLVAHHSEEHPELIAGGLFWTSCFVFSLTVLLARFVRRFSLVHRNTR
jgi:hypothetical protein